MRKVVVSLAKKRSTDSPFVELKASSVEAKAVKAPSLSLRLPAWFSVEIQNTGSIKLPFTERTIVVPDSCVVPDGGFHQTSLPARIASGLKLYLLLP
jgi:hypothetical protein